MRADPGAAFLVAAEISPCRVPPVASPWRWLFGANTASAAAKGSYALQAAPNERFQRGSSFLLLFPDEVVAADHLLLRARVQAGVGERFGTGVDRASPSWAR